MFEKISNATDAKARAAIEDEPPDDPTAMEFQEMVQREVDSLIGLARRIAEAPP
jgi:hypothetical protein